MQGNWRLELEPKFGFMHTFNDLIKEGEIKNKHLFPDLRKGSTFFVGSDFSGQQTESKFTAKSFLFTNLDLSGLWEIKRRAFRKKYSPDGRRISHKNLNDSIRQNALSPFLSIANNLNGLNLTILFDKNMVSLFNKTGRLKMSSPELKEHSHRKTSVFENALQAIHLVSFFTSGLSNENQDLFWFMDEDEIVANDERLNEFVNLFINISSHYLPHQLRHCKIGTTKSDTGKRDIEDLVAIPDLISGSLCDLLTKFNKEKLSIPKDLLVFPPKDLKLKTQKIMDWFADNDQPLKRLTYLIEEDPSSIKLRIQKLNFPGIKLL